MTRRAALLGLAALTVSGCSFEPVSFQPASETPEPTESVDPAVVVDPEYFMRGRDGSAKSLPEGTRTVEKVASPHLTFTLEDRFAGDRLSEETTAQVGEAAPLRAPVGHELVAFTLKSDLPGYIETADHQVSVELRVGEKYVPLPALFDKYNVAARSYLREWEMVIICVALEQPVVLEITDEGKTIHVDLRTGLPVIDDAWLANTGFRERQTITSTPDNGVFRREVTTLAPEGFTAQSGTLALGLQPDTGSGLLPWTPTLGWAPEAHQWLAVPMNVRVGAEGDVYPQLTMDVRQSFQYQDGAGTKHAAVHPETITTEALARNQVQLIVSWPVTGRDTAAIVSFNPVGQLSVDYSDYPKMPAQFSSEAAPLEFTLAFAPR